MKIFNYLSSTQFKRVVLYPFLLGLTLCFSFPPYDINYLIFISIAIFIIGLEKTNAAFWYGYNFYLGAVTAFIGYWFSYYFRQQLDTGYITSYALTSIICFYTAIYIGIISLLYSKLKTKYSFFNIVLLIPSLWVLTELIRGFLFPRSWYALGNTQVNNIIFRGYYPLFGVYFVSWLVVAIAGLIAWYYFNRKHIKVVFIIICISIFCCVSYILSEINYTKVYGKPIKVALLQPSEDSTEDFNLDDLFAIERVSQHLVETSHADLIVLPETVFSVDYHYLTMGYFDNLKSIVNQRHEKLIFGSPVHWEMKPHQTGIIDVDNPDNPIYTKYYLVPFGEYDPFKNTFIDPYLSSIGFKIQNFVRGNYTQPPTKMVGQLFAFNVCYENTINDYVANNAKLATILINQSDLSWYGKTHMKDVSLQFSQARALENQRYFLQDGNTGDTVIINPKGQIEKAIPSFTTDSLIGDVQGYIGITPFEYWYNTPIWLLCGIVILISILLNRFKHRKSS